MRVEIAIMVIRDWWNDCGGMESSTLCLNLYLTERNIFLIKYDQCNTDNFTFLM